MEDVEKEALSVFFDENEFKSTGDDSGGTESIESEVAISESPVAEDTFDMLVRSAENGDSSHNGQESEFSFSELSFDDLGSGSSLFGENVEGDANSNYSQPTLQEEPNVPKGEELDTFFDMSKIENFFTSSSNRSMEPPVRPVPVTKDSTFPANSWNFDHPEGLLQLYFPQPTRTQTEGHFQFKKNHGLQLFYNEKIAVNLESHLAELIQIQRVIREVYVADQFGDFCQVNVDVDDNPDRVLVVFKNGNVLRWESRNCKRCHIRRFVRPTQVLFYCSGGGRLELDPEIRKSSGWWLVNECLARLPLPSANSGQFSVEKRKRIREMFNLRRYKHTGKNTSLTEAAQPPMGVIPRVNRQQRNYFQNRNDYNRTDVDLHFSSDLNIVLHSNYVTQGMRVVSDEELRFHELCSKHRKDRENYFKIIKRRGAKSPLQWNPYDEKTRVKMFTREFRRFVIFMLWTFRQTCISDDVLHFSILSFVDEYDVFLQDPSNRSDVSLEMRWTEENAKCPYAFEEQPVKCCSQIFTWDSFRQMHPNDEEISIDVLYMCYLKRACAMFPWREIPTKYPVASIPETNVLGGKTKRRRRRRRRGGGGDVSTKMYNNPSASARKSKPRPTHPWKSRCEMQVRVSNYLTHDGVVEMLRSWGLFCKKVLTRHEKAESSTREEFPHSLLCEDYFSFMESFQVILLSLLSKIRDVDNNNVDIRLEITLKLFLDLFLQDISVLLRTAPTSQSCMRYISLYEDLMNEVTANFPTHAPGNESQTQTLEADTTLLPHTSSEKVFLDIVVSIMRTMLTFDNVDAAFSDCRSAMFTLCMQSRAFRGFVAGENSIHRTGPERKYPIITVKEKISREIISRIFTKEFSRKFLPSLTSLLEREWAKYSEKEIRPNSSMKSSVKAFQFEYGFDKHNSSNTTTDEKSKMSDSDLRFYIDACQCVSVIHHLHGKDIFVECSCFFFPVFKHCREIVLMYQIAQKKEVMDWIWGVIQWGYSSFINTIDSNPLVYNDVLVVLASSALNVVAELSLSRKNDDDYSNDTRDAAALLPSSFSIEQRHFCITLLKSVVIDSWDLFIGTKDNQDSLRSRAFALKCILQLFHLSKKIVWNVKNRQLYMLIASLFEGMAQRFPKLVDTWEIGTVFCNEVGWSTLFAVRRPETVGEKKFQFHHPYALIPSIEVAKFFKTPFNIDSFNKVLVEFPIAIVYNDELFEFFTKTYLQLRSFIEGSYDDMSYDQFPFSVLAQDDQYFAVTVLWYCCTTQKKNISTKKFNANEFSVSESGLACKSSGTLVECCVEFVKILKLEDEYEHVEDELLSLSKSCFPFFQSLVRPLCKFHAFGMHENPFCIQLLLSCAMKLLKTVLSATKTKSGEMFDRWMSLKDHLVAAAFKLIVSTQYPLFKSKRRTEQKLVRGKELEPVRLLDRSEKEYSCRFSDISPVLFDYLGLIHALIVDNDAKFTEVNFDEFYLAVTTMLKFSRFGFNIPKNKTTSNCSFADILRVALEGTKQFVLLNSKTGKNRSRRKSRRGNMQLIRMSHIVEKVLRASFCINHLYESNFRRRLLEGELHIIIGYVLQLNEEVYNSTTRDISRWPFLYIDPVDKPLSNLLGSFFTDGGIVPSATLVNSFIRLICRSAIKLRTVKSRDETMNMMSKKKKSISMEIPPQHFKGFATFLSNNTFIATVLPETVAKWDTFTVIEVMKLASYFLSSATTSSSDNDNGCSLILKHFFRDFLWKLFRRWRLLFRNNFNIENQKIVAKILEDAAIFEEQFALRCSLYSLEKLFITHAHCSSDLLDLLLDGDENGDQKLCWFSHTESESFNNLLRIFKENLQAKHRDLLESLAKTKSGGSRRMEEGKLLVQEKRRRILEAADIKCKQLMDLISNCHSLTMKRTLLSEENIAMNSSNLNDDNINTSYVDRVHLLKWEEEEDEESELTAMDVDGKGAGGFDDDDQSKVEILEEMFGRLDLIGPMVVGGQGEGFARPRDLNEQSDTGKNNEDENGGPQSQPVESEKDEEEEGEEDNPYSNIKYHFV